MKKKIFFTVTFVILSLIGFSQTKENTAYFLANEIIMETDGTDITNEDEIKENVIVCQLSDIYDLDRMKSSIDIVDAKHDEILCVSPWEYDQSNEWYWSNYIVSDYLIKLVYSEEIKLIIIFWD